MEKILLTWDEKTTEITSLVHKLRDYLAGRPVPKSIRDGLASFENNLKKYNQVAEFDDIENIAQAAKMVAVYGQTIGQAVSKFKEADENVKEIGKELLQSSEEFRSIVEDSPLDYKPLDSEREDGKFVDLHSFQSIKKNLKQLSADHELHDQRVKKLLNENEIRIEKLNGLSKDLEDEVKGEIEKVSKLYESSLADLESKKSQMDDILGHVSGRAIAGDFEKSAADERSMANWLRYSALFCMVLIVSVVAYSFWETTSSDFNWQNSIFRIVLAFMLSVPAAYLARESAKHREQQYAHQQTSLDLKAIAPYIASLPEEEQHKIKIEIAGRLFGARDSKKAGVDPFPASAHEVMLEVIKNLDLKRK